MATQRQVALPGSLPQPAPNARVSMFLQKLYKIVDDPSTNEVICWSDTGDSFFVLDHERLAKEHLGKWFKHNKFPSFVRQLNMYGFHKIPHLQQGVLKSDSTTEHWQFFHEHFRRGEEDRLVYIERKKQQAQPKSSTSAAEQQGQLALPATDSTQPSNLDIHSIVTGISAIRRHQTTISTELQELKQSNEALWRESMEARNRHTKQQDTINRIIRFLAGIFGQQGGPQPHSESDVSPSPANAVVPRSRLMIEDRLRHNDPLNKVRVVEVEDEDAKGTPVREVTPSFPPSAADTPSTADPPSPSSVPLFSIDSENDFGLPPMDNVPPQNDNVISTQAHYPGSNTNTAGLISPSRSPNQNIHIQNALSQLSAADLQQLFASLGGNMPNFDPHSANTEGLVTPYQSQAQSGNNLDFSSLPPSLQTIAGSPPPHLSSSQFPSTPDELMAFDDDPYKLDRQWEATEDIEKDVASLNTGINSLMETLGLSPEYLAANGIDPPQAGHQSDDQMFSTFLNTFPPGDDGGMGDLNDGFMDEEPEPPVIPAGTESEVGAGSRRKRKSDVALEPTMSGIPNSMTSTFDAGTGANTRSKRRKG